MDSNISMNEQTQSGAGFDIKYGNIETIPFPEEAKPVINLGNAFTVSNGKFFKERFAVVNLHGEFITQFDLKRSVIDKVKCFGRRSILLPRENAWSICDFKGKPFVDKLYDDVVELQNSYLAVGQTNKQTHKLKYALADIFGNPKTAFDYDKINEFVNGIAFARGQQKTDVFDVNGNITCSVECDEMRDFCNGYAIFNKNGRYGAVDTSGKVVVEPKYLWLSDCDHGCFRYSDVLNPTNMSDMGVVDSSGAIILNINKGLKDLTILNEHSIAHHVTYLHQTSRGNETITYRIKATGFCFGDKIIESKYLFVGEEQEGLMAFVTYVQSSPPPFISKGAFKIGYMDADFNTVFTIVNYHSNDSFDFGNLFVREYQRFLSPFINGTAVVRFQQGEERTFIKSKPYIADNFYVIDKKGNRIIDSDIILQRLSIHDRLTYESSNEDNSSDKSSNNLTDENQLRNLLKEKGLSVVDLFKRSECKKIIENFWFVKDYNVERFVFSRLESMNNQDWGRYSCGLLLVKNAKGLYGFVDENCEIVVEPVYKNTEQFIENANFAMRDKQWFILKRSCEVLPGLFPAASNGESSLPVQESNCKVCNKPSTSEVCEDCIHSFVNRNKFIL